MSKAPVLKKRVYTAAEVMQMFSAQAEQQADIFGRQIASSIGIVLHRFGEKSITICPQDIADLGKTHTVEIKPTGKDREYIYRLVQVGLEDQETGDLPLEGPQPNPETTAIIMWIIQYEAIRPLLRTLYEAPSRDRGLARLKQRIIDIVAKEKPHRPPAAESMNHCLKRNLQASGGDMQTVDWDAVTAKLYVLDSIDPPAWFGNIDKLGQVDV